MPLVGGRSALENVLGVVVEVGIDACGGDVSATALS